jgi:hypothetical protein
MPLIGVLLSALPVFTIADSTPDANRKPPTEITLERDGFGRPAGLQLCLRADVKATRRITGKARHGTADQVFVGIVDRGEFERIGALMESQGFFDLKDEYGVPGLADGEWMTIGAVRGGHLKRVTSSNRAGPPVLGTIEAAIALVEAKIEWNASGP